LSLEVHDDRVAIVIADNGKGLPHEERDRLTEPYVTTRAKGTGLGLAIVKKVMEDHGGELVLEDRPSGVGAQVRLVIPKSEISAPAVAAEDLEQKQSRYGA
jgi:two-component system nitrogen regulation sensor histidine kinase NtrY